MKKNKDKETFLHHISIIGVINEKVTREISVNFDLLLYNIFAYFTFYVGDV